MIAARGSLVVRFVVLAIVQVIVAVIVGDVLVRQATAPQHTSSIVPNLAADIVARALDEHGALDATLERLEARDGIEATVYREIHGGEAELVASNVEPPLPMHIGGGARPDVAPGPPRGGPRPPLRLPLPGPGPGEGPPRVVRVARSDGTYAVVTHVAPPDSASPRVPPPLVNLLASLGVISLWAFLVGRWVVAPVRVLTRAVRAVGAGDLTARTRLERRDELGEVGRAFDEMAQRLEQMLGAERELLANVSHELRTPLARIRVALDLAIEGDATAARLAFDEIGADLAELDGIVDDVLTATRFEIAERHGGFAIHREDTRPEAIVRQAEARFYVRHPDRTLTVAIEDDLPSIEVDPKLFRRAIDNLLENAHKYTPERDRPIALRAVRAEDAVTFAIADRGMGIPPEDLPHVFAPFFRGDKSRSRGTGGVGLGLTLAKRVVEAHSGAITVESGAGGTTFRVILPVASSGAARPSRGGNKS